MSPKRFIVVLVQIFFALAAQSAAFADEGYLIRNGVSQVNSPVSGKTVLYDESDNNLKYYLDGDWVQLNAPPSNYTGLGAPTSANDSTQGYQQGSTWVDTSDNAIYVCTDATPSAAVWQEISARISATDVRSKLTTSDLFSDWLISGLVGSVPASTLTMTTPSGIAVVSGQRLAAGPFIFTYPVSDDTYEYLQTDGTINRVSVGNGSPAPVGQPGLATQKVVTDGSQITSVTQLAISLPQLSINPAVNGNQAVTLTQANGLYAPLTWFPSNILVPLRGGLGTSIAPSAGQVPIGTIGGIYVPGTLTSTDGSLSIGIGGGGTTLDLSVSPTSTNYLINGGFDIWEGLNWDGSGAGVNRPDNTYSGANRWCLATDGTYVNTTTANGNGGVSAGTGMKSFYQCRLQSDGHAGLFQVLESCDSVPLRNRTATFQAAVASNTVPQNFRLAILVSQSTADFGGGIHAHTYPVSNWGSTVYDNVPGDFFSSGLYLVAVSPSCTCSTTNQFQTFSVTGVMPSTVSNVYCIVWTENSIGGGGISVMVGECCLTTSPTAVAYLPPNVALETLKCHRYYQRFVDHSTYPASGSNNGLVHFHSPDAITAGVAGKILYGFNFEPMRKIPTVSFRGPTTGSTGSNGEIFDVTTGQTVTNITPGGLSENRFEYFNVGSSNGQNVSLNDELETELELDAEL